ncbi:alpha/beta hydrolase [Paramylibacter ulvae]|nr:alpha/beta fold hydrolase [Amylibacter ulvae]
MNRLKLILAIPILAVICVGVWMIVSELSAPEISGNISSEPNTGGMPPPPLPAPATKNDFPMSAPSEPMSDPVVTLEPPIVVMEPSVEANLDPEETSSIVQLYYATNRNLVPEDQRDADDQTSQYGNFDGDLRYGVAEVSIPRDHEMGELESPNWFIEKIFGFDEEKHVVLQWIAEDGKEAVMAGVRDDLSQLDDRAILAFVHGFNTSFEKAARRTGQLKYDLGFAGPTFFFSWPSKALGSAYTHDSQVAEITYTDMTAFLGELTAQDAERVIVIAHSMGTRILSQGLADLIVEDPDAAAKITTVVLAAPDIDAKVFKERLAPKFRTLSRPVTLYASDNDTALRMSETVNGLIRIGDASNGLNPVEGIDLIDASNVKSDFFGHTYFGDNKSILSDMKNLFELNEPVDIRKGLERVETPLGPYWRITGN